jgi:O-antigen/teichoic acid export membrane protein
VGIINFILLSILCFWRNFILTFIFGKEYQMAQTFLVILSVAVFFESFKIVADPLLKGTQYARVSTFIEIIRFGIILTGGILLIHIWSALGAAIGILIVYFSSSFLKLFFVKRRLDIPCLSIFYYSFSWVLLLIISLLLQIPFPLFLVLTLLVLITERVISWKDVNSLWVFLHIRV